MAFLGVEVNLPKVPRNTTINFHREVIPCTDERQQSLEIKLLSSSRSFNDELRQRLSLIVKKKYNHLTYIVLLNWNTFVLGILSLRAALLNNTVEISGKIGFPLGKIVQAGYSRWSSF